MKFVHPNDSHGHSLQVLNALYEYDDFMASIATMVDLGCGDGADLAWWATATTRDEVPEPLNIRCQGVDILPQLPMARQHANVTYQCVDFEGKIQPPKKGFDVLWCHDAFQYCINPLSTLAKWNTIAEPGGMLIMAVPQTTNMDIRQLAFVQPTGCYYHHTVVSLMHMLAVNGWDCNSGFFLKHPDDEFIHVIAYKSNHAPMDPKTTTWYELADKNLLPETAVRSINRYGHVRQQDLVLAWIDKSLSWLGQQ